MFVLLFSPPFANFLPKRRFYANPARARRALRALGLLLADGAATVGWGKTFWCVGRFLFYENDRNSETKSRKVYPKVRNEPSLRGLQNLGLLAQAVSRKTPIYFVLGISMLMLCIFTIIYAILLRQKVCSC